jgi:hypothetical protein
MIASLHSHHIRSLLEVSTTDERGFFSGAPVTPPAPQAVLASLEAIIGLFIELVLMAMFSCHLLGDERSEIEEKNV